MAEQDPNKHNFVEILKSSARSAGFWSFVSVVVGVIATAAGGIAYLTVDEISGTGLSVLIGGLVLLFVALVLAPTEVAGFIAGRQGRYGMNIIIMTIAFFTIAILINFLLFRSPTRIDTTATRVFTLAPQTTKVLESLTGPVRATAFFTPGDPTQEQTEDLLNEFERRGDNFGYRFIDPELNRSLAVQYNVPQSPAIIFEEMSDGTRQGILEFNEQNFVTGILVATGVAQKKVVYLTGHDEPGITRDPIAGGIQDDGFDFVFDGLQRDNYRVAALNLQQFRTVPEDVAVLLIAGPKQDLTSDEAAALTEYLERGGSVVALFDPNPPQSFVDLLAPWGATVAKESVADAVSNVAGEFLTPLIQSANAQFVSSANLGITDQIDVVFFPDATAISSVRDPVDMPVHTRFAALARSTPASWLESDPENVNYDPETEPLGPFAVVAVLESQGTMDNPNFTVPATRFIIFGDSDFARNRFFFSNDNADLLLNSVNWLAEDFDLISIRPKVFPFRELIVNTRERDFIKWSSWFFPPFVMILLGTYVWWRRR